MHILMYQGRFPEEPPRGAGVAPRGYLPGPWQPEALDPPDPGRRRWLLGVAALAGAACTGVLLRALGLGSPPGAGAGPAAVGGTTVPESASWPLVMLEAEPEDLLAAAGDLERLSLRDPRAPGLVACFARILELALERGGPEADLAGACAVRSLVRLGRPELVEAQRLRLEARLDLPSTAGEMDWAFGTAVPRRSGR